VTSRPPTQCLSCKHFRSPLNEGVVQPTWPNGTGSCDAYPDKVDAIPGEIWWNRADHRAPYEGDHGIQWEAREGAEFPERFMNIPA
jgi:hypothetical protein